MPLSPAQEKAALLIAEGLPITKVAQAVHRSQTTVKDWKKRNVHGFRDRIEELRRNISQETVRYLQANLLNNVEIIQQIAEGKAHTLIVDDDKVLAIDSAAVNTRLRAAMWAAEKILRPAIKEAEKAPVDTTRQKSAAEAQLYSMGEEDLDDLATRGVE